MFGQNLPGDNNYNFKGRLDAVSIFDYGLSPAQIRDHMDNSINVGVNEKVLAAGKRYRIFPNPVTGSDLQIEVNSLSAEMTSFSLTDLSGKKVLERCGIDHGIEVAGMSSYFDTATPTYESAVP